MLVVETGLNAVKIGGVKAKSAHAIKKCCDALKLLSQLLSIL